MHDFMSGERLYGAGLDSKNQVLVVPCRFIRSRKKGWMKVMLDSGEQVHVHMKLICKTPEDAKALAQRLKT